MELDASALIVSSGAAGWKGPYIGLKANTTTKTIDTIAGNRYSIIFVADSNIWGDTVLWWNDTSTFCTSGKTCFIWVLKKVYSNGFIEMPHINMFIL